ncbi:MAG: hypothetical protein ACOZF2_00905 [Thermodesulfobacteriota bacterium]
MATGRGKKTKKPQWQLSLGMKQVIFGALGLTWMMMIIFILGVLAGRGDIYRWLSSWGLITPGPANIVQWSPPPEAPVATASPKPVTPGPLAKLPAPVPSTSAPAPPPITGAMAPAPGLTPTPAKAAPPRVKKTKKGISHRDYKAQEAELRKLRREVAKKLVFQNTIGGETANSAHKSPKKKGKAVNSPKEPARRVRVAQFRNLKSAKTRMAELQKKGEKVTLKKGKDKKGIVYEIYREAPVKPVLANMGPTQKAKKSEGKKPKRQAGVRQQ